MASTQIQPIYTMKKLLMISSFALITSLAHAGSCGGDGSGKDKKGETTGASESSVVIACGSSDSDKGQDAEGKASFSSAQFEVAGSCGGGDKTDKDEKNAKTTFSAQYEALV